MRLSVRGGSIMLLVSISCVLPVTAQVPIDPMWRVKEFITLYSAGEPVAHLFEAGSEAPSGRLEQVPEAWTVSPEPLRGTGAPVRIEEFGSLLGVRITGSKRHVQKIFRTRVACGSTRLTVIETFNEFDRQTDIRIVPFEESVGTPVDEDQEFYSGAPALLTSLMELGAEARMPDTAVSQPAIDSAVVTATRLCSRVGPDLLGGTTELIPRGMSYSGSALFERLVFTFDIQVSERGLLKRWTFLLPPEQALARQAAEGQASIDEQQVMREKLDTVTIQMERQYRRLTVVNTDFYAADAADALLRFSRQATASAFDAPSLAVAKRVTTSYVGRITANVERVQIGEVAVIAKAAIDRAIEATLKLWRKYREAEDLTPNLRIFSTPQHARVMLQVGEDEKTRRQTETNDSLANVWLGIYDATLTLTGHKSASFIVDLLNDSRTTIRCKLVLKSSDDESRCRRFADDEREPVDE